MENRFDALVALDREIAGLHARRAALIEAARVEILEQPRPGSTWDPVVIARRELSSELACALRIPERSAERLIAESRALCTQLPATLEALASGRISYRHAQVVVDQASTLPASALPDFEGDVLPLAEVLTAAQFERRARVRRELVHPESRQVRHERAVGERSVTIDPGKDGMCWLTAHLPAVDALAIYNRITDAARGLQGAAEPRTLTQLRADVFCELMFGGKGIVPRVFVTVPALTLLGTDGGPAMLDGFGPIDDETARRLCALAPSFTRLLTHPETGAVLSVGRDRYAVPADLRKWLQVRDGTCRYPGCSRAAPGCEIDHTLEWANRGPTDHDNLAHLCPMHHALRHNTAWRVKQTGGGGLAWTSPSGAVYRTSPATVMRR
ncbi:HNH endonuclease signature motif containing protein [Glaciihabitans arcticus]|nr:HNH endonuclease signature motif containing protein [Glaciihabitans arcticus]